MRILLAIDGSDDARAASESLVEFPLPAPLHLFVVSVVTLPQALVEIAPVRTVNEALRAQGRRIVDDARATLAPRFGDVEGRVLEGDPRLEIVDAAERWGAEFIVVGARGLGPFRSAVLGSVSTTVVRHAPCPVLVVKRPVPALRSLVLAVDGSPHSIAAARFVAGLPLDRVSRIRLLAVAEPPRFALATPEVPMPLLTVFEEELRAREDTLREVLAGIAATLGGKGPAVESTVVVGGPSEEIVAAANEPGVDLVVVGARGLGAIKRLVLGSVSERVLHHATSAVLVVRT
ncbi:MAG: universal stress protein [Candidatus Rokubacteria bacterium]|nr:universal stress protein [Candidatus Rokubacteria bacterium]